MATFRKYGGTNFSPISNIVRHNILNSKSSSFNTTGLYNSKETYLSHIDMSGNSLLHVGNLYFQDGTSISTAPGLEQVLINGPSANGESITNVGSIKYVGGTSQNSAYTGYTIAGVYQYATLTLNNNGQIIDITNNTRLSGDTGPKGDEGDTGPKGDEGDTGPKGDEGDTGPKGDEGDAGPKGDEGDTGPKGDEGDTGPQGAKGDKGDTGPQGPQGSSGNNYTIGRGLELVTGTPTTLQVESSLNFLKGVTIINDTGNNGYLTFSDTHGSTTGSTNIRQNDEYLQFDNNTVTSVNYEKSFKFFCNNVGDDFKQTIPLQFNSSSFLVDLSNNAGGSPIRYEAFNNSFYSVYGKIGHNFTGNCYFNGNLNNMKFSQGTINNDSRSVVIGNSANTSFTGTGGNMLIGYQAGQGLTNGELNIFIGINPGQKIKTGDKNILIGHDSFFDNNSADYATNNIIIGNSAAYNASGSGNTFLGHNTGSNHSGNSNTFVGINAGTNGSTNTGNFGNTILGADTKIIGSIAMSTAIGYGASVNSNNTIVIGTSTETTQIPGNLTVTGTTYFNNRLLMNSTNADDRYIKTSYVDFRTTNTNDASYAITQVYQGNGNLVFHNTAYNRNDSQSRFAFFCNDVSLNSDIIPSDLSLANPIDFNTNNFNLRLLTKNNNGNLEYGVKYQACSKNYYSGLSIGHNFTGDCYINSSGGVNHSPLTIKQDNIYKMQYFTNLSATQYNGITKTGDNAILSYNPLSIFDYGGNTSCGIRIDVSNVRLQASNTKYYDLSYDTGHNFYGNCYFNNNILLNTLNSYIQFPNGSKQTNAPFGERNTYNITSNNSTITTDQMLSYGIFYVGGSITTINLTNISSIYQFAILNATGSLLTVYTNNNIIYNGSPITDSAGLLPYQTRIFTSLFSGSFIWCVV
jgi:hypothetical protein